MSNLDFYQQTQQKLMEAPQAKGQQWQRQVKLEDHSASTREHAQVSDWNHSWNQDE